MSIISPFINSTYIPLGFAGLFLASGLWLHFKNRSPKTIDISTQSEPLRNTATISTFCDSDTPGCAPYNEWGSGKVRFFRMGVKLDQGVSVRGCQAQLIRIERGGLLKWGNDTAILTFAPGENEDATSKTLFSGKVEFADIIALHYTGDLRAGTKERTWPFLPRLEEIFKERGDYMLTVAIVGEGLPAHNTKLRFTWTGEMDTSRITDAFGTSRSARDEVYRIANLVESRLVEISKSVAHGNSDIWLSEWFTQKALEGMPNPSVPPVHEVESEIIKDCNRLSREHELTEFREIANRLTVLNQRVADYVSPQMATFKKAQWILSESMQGIPPIIVGIRAEILKRFP